MSALLFAILDLQPALPRHTAMLYASLMHQQAHAHVQDRVDGEMLACIAMAESSLWADRVNKRTGAAGLMGIAPVHIQDWARPEDVMEPRRNIEMGAALFGKSMRSCRYNTAHALSHFDGRGCRDSAYSRKVLRLYERVQRHGRAAA